MSIQPYAFVVSSVYSSLIEGSSIDIEKYYSYKKNDNNSTDMIQIKDLIETYKFAKTHTLNLPNVLKAHAMLSKHFNIDAKYKGCIRDKKVTIGNFFVTVYEGALPTIVSTELAKLFADIAELKTKSLTYNEVFYYASYIHLMFLKIHPFADGNGRLSRIIEKWFIAQHIGNSAWLIPSEVYYQLYKKVYYTNLGIGTKYANIDTKLALDFLLMLPLCFSLPSKRYIF